MASTTHHTVACSSAYTSLSSFAGTNYSPHCKHNAAITYMHGVFVLECTQASSCVTISACMPVHGHTHIQHHCNPQSCKCTGSVHHVMLCTAYMHSLQALHRHAQQRYNDHINSLGPMANGSLAEMGPVAFSALALMNTFKPSSTFTGCLVHVLAQACG